jgi:anhydro-N-acetylmuramic acid kinase
MAISDRLRIVGLMSGTSADGIDAALVSVDGCGEDTEVTLERFLTVPYPSDVRACVLETAEGSGGAGDIAKLHHRLGELFGRAALALLEGGEADLVASHGQTVAHVRLGHGRATLQLGCPAVIAALSRVTVISDFRSADIAAGGEGAPLVSFVDWILLRHPAKRRIALNIGGIANVTYLPPRTSEEPALAFDTGPGNAPIDAAVRALTGGSLAYDSGGEMAGRGSVDLELLAHLLDHSYLKQPPPKSTGLEEFGPAFAQRVVADGRSRGLSGEDIVATLTRFTAVSIAWGVRQAAEVDEVIVAGGGCHNATLMRFLREELGSIAVESSDSVGIPPDAKEALAFAVLANQTIRALPGTIPACTGAARAAVLGSVTPSANFQDLMRRLWGR